MSNLDVCLSHKSDHWATPKYIYDFYVLAGFYDPCPLHSTFDGLKKAWPNHVFVNPPYSETADWVNKAIDEAREGKVIVMLLASRTDSDWFQKLVNVGSDFTFIRKRLSFGENGRQAPFPSVLVWVGNSNFARARLSVKPREWFESRAKELL